MHSHISCIFMTFHNCAFSNVPSNCVLERMHSHIGCICMNFLHFSNASSNHLPVRMQSHTGCICLAFLHCVFSNVYPFLGSNSRREGEDLIFVRLLAFALPKWFLQTEPNLDLTSGVLVFPMEYFHFLAALVVALYSVGISTIVRNFCM